MFESLFCFWKLVPCCSSSSGRKNQSHLRANEMQSGGLTDGRSDGSMQLEQLQFISKTNDCAIHDGRKNAPGFIANPWSSIFRSEHWQLFKNMRSHNNWYAKTSPKTHCESLIRSLYVEQWQLLKSSNPLVSLSLSSIPSPSPALFKLANCL